MIDHWHNAPLMHPGRAKVQKDLELQLLFLAGYYAFPKQYSKACASSSTTKHPKRCKLLCIAIPESPTLTLCTDEQERI